MQFQWRRGVRILLARAAVAGGIGIFKAKIRTLARGPWRLNKSRCPSTICALAEVALELAGQAQHNIELNLTHPTTARVCFKQVTAVCPEVLSMVVRSGGYKQAVLCFKQFRFL